jgi:RNA polymerase sigma factor (sigma-70 family)
MHARKPRERLLGPALRAQPDRRLVALARDGSEAAQEEIVRRYRPALVRYADSIVGATAAEDVVQGSLAKAMAALGGAEMELRPRPWLYAIVRNTALNHLRDAGPPVERLDESYDGVEQPPQALERHERMRSLVGGLRRLPMQQREALVKRELEGRSHDEIGAALGVSSGAARQLIFRAREALRMGFGSLLPMPLLRWLAENSGDRGALGAAAGAGGGALAAKTVLTVLAAGAAVSAGVAIDHDDRERHATPPAATATRRPAVAAPSRGAVPPQPESVAVRPGSGSRESAAEDGPDHHDGHRGRSSGRRRDDGSGEGAGGRSGGRGPGGSSGPGSGGGASESRSDDDGPGSSGDNGSGTSGGGPGGGTEISGGHGGGSGSSGGSGSTSDSDGSGGGSSTSGGSGSGGTSGGSSNGGGDVVATSPAPVPSPPTPALEPAPASGWGSSGSSSGDGKDTSPGSSRDLSGASVSQGSNDLD